jgi:hypothetical protein
MKQNAFWPIVTIRKGHAGGGIYENWFSKHLVPEVCAFVKCRGLL